MHSAEPRAVFIHNFTTPSHSMNRIMGNCFGTVPSQETPSHIIIRCGAPKLGGGGVVDSPFIKLVPFDRYGMTSSLAKVWSSIFVTPLQLFFSYVLFSFYLTSFTFVIPDFRASTMIHKKKSCMVQEILRILHLYNMNDISIPRSLDFTRKMRYKSENA